jgi:hypothetical protein
MSATSSVMTPYKFATDKLLPVPEGKQGVVLVACGSFNPPTVLHMRMFGKKIILYKLLNIYFNFCDA